MPFFVKNIHKNKNIFINFKFDGYGNKFDHENDALVKKQLKNRFCYDTIESWLTLEGGAIETNGNGVIAASIPSVLLRNGVSKNSVEKELSRTIGANVFIWLPSGLSADM